MLTLLLALVFPIRCAGQPPIPVTAQSVGYELLEDAAASAQIEMFGDFSCDETAAAWGNIVKPLLETFQTGGLSLIFRPFPLPYHHNSFDAAQSARAIIEHLSSNNNSVAKAAFVVADAFFTQQTRFMSWQTPNPTANMTQSEVITTIFADIAVSVGMPRTSFQQAVGVGWNTNANGPFSPTRDAWKYAAARGVCSTPTFTANGVFSEALDDWDIAAWTDWIQAANAASHQVYAETEQIHAQS